MDIDFGDFEDNSQPKPQPPQQKQDLHINTSKNHNIKQLVDRLIKKKGKNTKETKRSKGLWLPQIGLSQPIYKLTELYVSRKNKIKKQLVKIMREQNGMRFVHKFEKHYSLEPFDVTESMEKF